MNACNLRWLSIAWTALRSGRKAAGLPIARPEERYLSFYRKAYCELFSAFLTGSSDSFQAASKDFTETIANWPRRTGTRPPAGLYAMVSIARAEQGRMADSYP